MAASNFTGVIGNDKNTTIGAWLTDEKNGRSRCLGVVTQNFPGYKSDMAYLGYFVDQKDPKIKGCNFSLALGDGEVIFQSVNPETNVLSMRAIPVEKFFDIMDMLAMADIPAMIEAGEKAGEL